MFRRPTPHYVLLAVQVDGDAVQDISWPGLQAPVEAYIRKDLSAGAAAYLAVVVASRKWRRF